MSVQANLRNISDPQSMSDPIVRDMADETLRLSSREVPHDVGTLQLSGNRKRLGVAYYQVGYGGSGAPYAVRLHENPQYRFQKGRKGKYLEDPIKNNLDRFQRFYRDEMFKAMKRRIK